MEFGFCRSRKQNSGGGDQKIIQKKKEIPSSRERNGRKGWKRKIRSCRAIKKREMPGQKRNINSLKRGERRKGQKEDASLARTVVLRDIHPLVNHSKRKRIRGEEKSDEKPPTREIVYFWGSQLQSIQPTLPFDENYDLDRGR